MDIYTAWIDGYRYSGPAISEKDFLLSKGYGLLTARNGRLYTTEGREAGTIMKRYKG